MLREEVEQLAGELTGDEHTWIDLKRHYPIDKDRGNEKKADFIKDIAAMANTVSLQPNYSPRFLNEDERYIMIGVDDSGDIVGTTEDLSGYTSLLEVDTSTPQNILADYLTPTPDIEIHKYDDTEPYLCLIVVEAHDSPPVTISRELGSELSRGDVYIRDGDRNRPARREDYQDFVQFHLEKERDYITDGIQQVVGMNIDYLRDLGEVREVEAEDDDNVIPVSPGEDGPDIQSSLIDPIELDSISRELNADVTKWRRRDRHSCSEESLYDYYLNTAQLDLAEEQLAFLVQSSWNNGHLGSFWVWKMESKDPLLHAVENTNIRSMESNHTLYLGQLLACLGSEDTAEQLVDYTGVNDRSYRGHGSIVLRCAEESEPDHALRATGTTAADGFETPGWTLSKMDPEELIEVIETVCSELRSVIIESPEASQSGLKGWMRNAETYLAYQDDMSDDLDERIRSNFEA